MRTLVELLPSCLTHCACLAVSLCKNYSRPELISPEAFALPARRDEMGQTLAMKMQKSVFWHGLSKVGRIHLDSIGGD